MSSSAPHILELAVLAASAALAMSLAGLQKKVLRRKGPNPRCPTCGRIDRYNCACRR